MFDEEGVLEVEDGWVDEGDVGRTEEGQVDHLEEVLVLDSIKEGREREQHGRSVWDVELAR